MNLLKDHHKEAFRDLRKLAPAARAQLLWEFEQDDLHEAEKNKAIHDKANFKLPEDQWVELKKHLMDGGGSIDGHRVGKILLTALLDNDQDVFWSELFHFVKAAGKHLGLITLHAESGAVTFNGIAPTEVLRFAEQQATKVGNTEEKEDGGNS